MPRAAIIAALEVPDRGRSPGVRELMVDFPRLCGPGVFMRLVLTFDVFEHRDGGPTNVAPSALMAFNVPGASTRDAFRTGYLRR